MINQNLILGLLSTLNFRITRRDIDRQVRDGGCIQSSEIMYHRTRVHHRATLNTNGRIAGWDPLNPGSRFGCAARKKDPIRWTMGRQSSKIHKNPNQRRDPRDPKTRCSYQPLKWRLLLWVPTLLNCLLRGWEVQEVPWDHCLEASVFGVQTFSCAHLSYEASLHIMDIIIWMIMTTTFGFVVCGQSKYLLRYISKNSN